MPHILSLERASANDNLHFLQKIIKIIHQNNAHWFSYRDVQFALLLIVWVQAALEAELAEVAMHIDAVLTVRTEELILIDIAQRHRAELSGPENKGWTFNWPLKKMEMQSQDFPYFLDSALLAVMPLEEELDELTMGPLLSPLSLRLDSW